MLSALRPQGWAELVDESRRPALWLLVGFVVTALATRLVTRVIRAKSQRPPDPDSVAAHGDSGGGLFKNIHIGGVHVHHQVWGILLALVVGFLLVSFRPDGGWLDLLAVLFGAGAALALDEFAMWLHLEDVYWREEGRKSISAMMTAAAICLVVVLGSNPLGLGSTGPSLAASAVAAVVGVNLLLVIGTILKGKLPMALVGIFLPFLAFVGVCRVAKPGSWWARRHYPPDSRKDGLSRERFGAAYERRWRWLTDLVGGAPDPVPPVAERVP